MGGGQIEKRRTQGWWYLLFTGQGLLLDLQFALLLPAMSLNLVFVALSRQLVLILCTLLGNGMKVVALSKAGQGVWSQCRPKSARAAHLLLLMCLVFGCVATLLLLNHSISSLCLLLELDLLLRKKPFEAAREGGETDTPVSTLFPAGQVLIPLFRPQTLHAMIFPALWPGR